MNVYEMIVLNVNMCCPSFLQLEMNDKSMFITYHKKKARIAESLPAGIDL